MKLVSSRGSSCCSQVLIFRGTTARHLLYGLQQYREQHQTFSSSLTSNNKTQHSRPKISNVPAASVLVRDQYHLVAGQAAVGIFPLTRNRTFPSEANRGLWRCKAFSSIASLHLVAKATSQCHQREPHERFMSTKTYLGLPKGVDNDFQQKSDMDKPQAHRAVIALGSNLGDKVFNIEAALSEMVQANINVVACSRLYETKPMYYTDQPTFLNGACLVETELQPLQLLDQLQTIENKLGRVRTIDKGPRTVDLDVILYDNDFIQHTRLTVPHPLLLEREFVLRPLADIVPEYVLPRSFTEPVLQSSTKLDVRSALSRLPDVDHTMLPATVLRNDLPLLRTDETGKVTQIMAIMNITPDSFSDGGLFFSDRRLETVVESAKQFISEGASILDIGGQSTRPNATLLSPRQELERIIPVVRAIRALPEAKDTAISIDTFYSEVAIEACKEGADIINDVSAGLLDPDMLRTAARLGKTIILMHMRGTPETMNSLCHYPNGVIAGVSDELNERFTSALGAGVLPWRIILDPGIGFAKTKKQNLELLRNGQQLRKTPKFEGLPWLIGTSRKGFIGNITGVVNAADRHWGTAASVTAAIAGGADIIRVHDVKEMAQVRAMADAIYRS